MEQDKNAEPSAQPLVTIALPVYNGAATLAVAVHSILTQSFSDLELIILNDASTDESLVVIQSFDDPRIRVVDGNDNIGLSARLNIAVRMAKGTYFARMDQDDISFPERIGRQVEFLQQHQEVDLLAAATVPFRGDGEALGCLPVHIEHEQICARPWNGFYLPHPTWMGKIQWFRQHHYESSADGAEDQHLLLRSFRVSHFACLNQPLLAYREGDRPLKKTFRARRIFARAYIHQFLIEKRYGLAIKVAVLFLLKVTADILNLVFGVAGMRNSLRPLTVSERSAWKTLWSELGTISANKIHAAD